MRKPDADAYMRDLFATRRANMRAIAKQHGGTVATAAMLKISQTRMSQLMNNTFGEQVARRLEEKLGIEFGALDRPINQGPKAGKTK